MKALESNTEKMAFEMSQYKEDLDILLPTLSSWEKSETKEELSQALRFEFSVFRRLKYFSANFAIQQISAWSVRPNFKPIWVKRSSLAFTSIVCMPSLLESCWNDALLISWNTRALPRLYSPRRPIWRGPETALSPFQTSFLVILSNTSKNEWQSWRLKFASFKQQPLLVSPTIKPEIGNE